ncbi:type II toxin-antitoxin system RelE/ParE family toxin [Nostoc sp. CALU 1950]|uniref:type II toxin-antitoxin system RelE/ParE family toxin n=1 Tax=Nostoc sp. CALU 1950 TaxID=3104321 RepID=UPI003EBA8C93
MSNYIISPSASRDLNEIADYFLPRNLEAGEKLFREFNKKCQNLANFPSMGRSYAHIKPSLRGLPLCIGPLSWTITLMRPNSNASWASFSIISI